MAAIALSSLTMTPLGKLRYGSTPEAELYSWLQACYRSELAAALNPPRIAEFDHDGLGPNVKRMEYLIVRDLDLDPLNHEKNPGHAKADDVRLEARGGRIVAYAEFVYHPRAEDAQSEATDTDGTATPGGSKDEVAVPPPPPPSVHGELCKYWDDLVETALQSQFGGMHCFEVRGLSTLAPSHLRKGIASRLLGWIFPWAERLHVPVVLAATPPGYPLYLKHGFVPVGPNGGVVECDMARWGGSGIHRHVLMIRWPEKQEICATVGERGR
ncbi:hypothetical protein A1O7_05827 [Cladophialophora yegresii CBS 114405]|uniref:N-acetyltransferase domain-containing protein n=1 Tax=Cladophialophora yegresii CBS 114405 TaxID=1182544 RepID=W9VRS5_9EURO|nr:uncharacterized protein A1O7_05827 [Cladophialophora yegresii CBS 114405]EXJ58402.1 hypothetical protein A1O7_05827 [Cladophialophora yegresii CBS 114405]